MNKKKGLPQTECLYLLSPRNTCVEAPMPSVAIFEDGASEEVIKVE